MCFSISIVILFENILQVMSRINILIIQLINVMTAIVPFLNHTYNSFWILTTWLDSLYREQWMNKFKNWIFKKYLLFCAANQVIVNKEDATALQEPQILTRELRKSKSNQQNSNQYCCSCIENNSKETLAVKLLQKFYEMFLWTKLLSNNLGEKLWKRLHLENLRSKLLPTIL